MGNRTDGGISRPRSPRSAVFAAAALCSLFALIVASRTADAQQPSDKRSATPARPAEPMQNRRVAGEGQYVGVASCAGSGCHGSTLPLQSFDVLQNEYYTWLNNDRHAQAYNVLFSERSARVARNMKLAGRAYEEKICLECHSTYAPAAMQAGRIDREDGVQCEACHGPAGGWRAQHTQQNWSHADSVRAGMVDLRSIPQRGARCLSCHQGNESKTVDHELIAAGHPILQFELDNYAESMPPHWRRFADKRNPEGRDTHGIRAWAVGQAVAFRESMEALSVHARGNKWPEFADMSCYNCHHDLRTSTWRQERGYTLRAGLPAWTPQRYVVLRHLIAEVAPSERAAFDRSVAELAGLVARMNQPAAVARLAGSTGAMVGRIIPAIDAIRWDDGQVRRLISRIASDGNYLKASDVHSAEQTALALQSLGSYLANNDRVNLRGDLLRSVDQLFKQIQVPSDYDPGQFVKTLEQIQGQVR